jgi:adenylyl- and sulfurtransferase ThiI
MSAEKFQSRANRLRRETADVLFDASVALRAGEYERAAELLEEKAESTDCELCTGTLTAAAGGIAYAASPVGVGRGERVDQVATELVNQAEIIDPHNDEMGHSRE